MNLIKWNNRSVFSDLFDHVFNNFDDDYKPVFCKPATNIVEYDNNYELNLAIPGLEKEDIKINLEDNVLTVSSEKENKNEEEKVNYSRMEYAYHNFSRSFTIPKTVNAEKINADYKNGVLNIILPKIEEAKLKKIIKIS